MKEKRFRFRGAFAFAGAGLVGGTITLGLVLGFQRSHGSTAGTEPAEPQAAAATEVVFACPGRIEGASEVVNVGAGVDGVFSEINVKEGQRVAAGQVVAALDRKDLNASLAEAQAAVAAAKMVRARLMRGSRDEERLKAAAETRSAEDSLQQARARYERYEQLSKQGVISADTRDEAFRNMRVADEALKAARKQEALVDAPPLPEEVGKADADIKAAEERVRALSEQSQKRVVRAPIAGTVLKVFMKVGETYSTLTPQPVLSMADNSRFRVRAEVDERDLGRVFLGQQASIRADALGKKEVGGRVSETGYEMGRKKVRTGDPAEKSDRDVLEVLIDLDQKDPALVIGLRVTVQFAGVKK